MPLAKMVLGLIIGTIFFGRERALQVSAIGSPIVRLILLLCGLAWMSLAYSAWKSQTIAFLISHLVMLVTIVVLIAGSTFTIRRLHVVAQTLMFVGVPLALSAILFSTSGRITFGFTYDPNDLALLLGALIPLVLAYAQQKKAGISSWALYSVAALYLAAIILTQSRGALIGMTLAALYLSWTGFGAKGEGGQYSKQSGGRWRRLAILAAIGVTTVILMPDAAKERLGTIVDLSNDYNVTAGATDNGRLAIWRRGLTVLLSRPWGVGAAAYPVADYMAGGRYITAHNSILQVTVELGLFGGMVFIALLVVGWRSSGRSRARLIASTPSAEHDSLLALVSATRASLIVLVVAGFFLSQAYALVLYAMLALISSIENHVGRLSRSDQSATLGMGVPSKSTKLGGSMRHHRLHGRRDS